MSRVGKKPLPIPKGIVSKLENACVTAEGPLGKLAVSINQLVVVEEKDCSLEFRPVDSTAKADAMSGTMRALVANLFEGVSKGFEKKLSLVGVGYKASVVDNNLNLQIGFSHPTIIKSVEGIKFECPTPSEIIIKGIDFQVVGQTAAEIREKRRPEPYKGKGIRYLDEKIVIKETKKK